MQPDLKGVTVSGDPLTDLQRAVRTTSEATKPNFSITFLALFLVVCLFHESHFVYVGPLLLSWLLVQAFVLVTDDEFHQHNLFWNVMTLLGNVTLYLILGYGWSLVKLYIDVWQGHFDPALMKTMQACISAPSESLSCIPGILLQLKWFIMRSMITWPASFIYTMSRDPLNIFLDLVFEWSKKRYILIISSALNQGMNNAEPSPWVLLQFVACVITYFVIGYLWTHVKLFLDVWKGTLPPTLDREARDVYERKASYWDFVVRIKWLVLQWMFTWPISMLFSIFQHPIKIVAEFVYDISQKKYMWVVGKAMEWRYKNKED